MFFVRCHHPAPLIQCLSVLALSRLSPLSNVAIRCARLMRLSDRAIRSFRLSPVSTTDHSCPLMTPSSVNCHCCPPLRFTTVAHRLRVLPSQAATAFRLCQPLLPDDFACHFRPPPPRSAFSCHRNDPPSPLAMAFIRRFCLPPLRSAFAHCSRP